MKATRESYGEALEKLGKKNKNIVVLDADLANATMTKKFKALYPKRFFDMGIAEQDMIGTAAGFAIGGKIPFASTFAIFAAGRAYEQIRNSVAYPNLNVKIVATHAGLTVGEDGASHQAIEDISLMRTIPGMIVLSPCDDIETKWAIEWASKYDGPVYVRLTRPKVESIYGENPELEILENDEKQKEKEQKRNLKPKFEVGKMIVHGKGSDATIFATGVEVQEALKAKNELSKKGINIRVVDVHTIKPIDKDTIIKCAKETKKLFTVEDHSIIGGLGSSICEVLSEEYPVKVIRLGVKDEFGTSGKWNELLEKYELNCKNIVEKVQE